MLEATQVKQIKVIMPSVRAGYLNNRGLLVCSTPLMCAISLMGLSLVSSHSIYFLPERVFLPLLIRHDDHEAW